MTEAPEIPVVRIQAGRHKRAALGSPWIFSNEIVMDGAAKALPAGEIVRFYAHDRSFIGTGSFNAHSLIAGRIFTRKPLEEIDAAFFAKRFKAARDLRDRLIPDPFYRLIHAEADGLPGLVIDRFDDCFSLQANSAGMDRLMPSIVEALEAVFAPKAIIAHNESSVRALEGLARATLALKGEMPSPIRVCENGLTYFADLVGGQKTGWYFDQRDNHALVARFAQGARVLDLYCHAGGFGICAAKAGAISVVGVDSSESALKLAAPAASENDVAKVCEWVKADVFDDLQKRAGAKERFEIVIADPPPFVKSRKDMASGARGYRKLARLSAELVTPGGLLFIASCSHNMTLDAFGQEVARGLAEAKREGRILYTVFAAPDHPQHPHLPESAYLKGFLVNLD
jgi:23S rRNA (cytosine1962-C5)-methyltransferase